MSKQVINNRISLTDTINPEVTGVFQLKQINEILSVENFKKRNTTTVKQIRNLDKTINKHLLNGYPTIQDYYTARKNIIKDLPKIKELEEQKRKLKLQLPSVLFSGWFDYAKDSNVKSHSNLLVFDLDNLYNTKIFKYYWHLVTNYKHTVYAYRSPSGSGIKFVIRTD